MTSILKKSIPFFISILCGILFTFLLSIGSSPLYKGDSLVFDATVFQSMGWLWQKGFPPFLYSWDQKGPLIFAINALGFFIGGGGIQTTCLCIMEGLSVGLFIYIAFLTFRLYFDKRVSSFLSIITVIVLAGSYAGGANTEGFTLPIWGASLLFTFKWLNEFDKGLYRFNPWYGFFNGFFLAFAFLTRLTNAAGACGIMAAVCILLIIKGEWKNLFENIGMFLLGFILLSAPFFIYFYAIGGIDEMMFGTIWFNVLYSTESLYQPIVKYITHILSGFPAYALLAFSVLLFFLDKHERPRAFVWFMATIMMCLWWFPSRKFLKYIILAVPFLPILLIELDRQKSRFPKWITMTVMGLCCLIPMENLRFIHQFKDTTILPLTERLDKEIPIEDRSSFMAYEMNPQIYMNLNAVPCYRFHIGQEHFSAESPVVKQEIHELFASKKAKWICVKGNPTVIQDILDTSYHLEQDYSDIGPFRLFQRNE